MKISVIVPVYNAAKYIRQAVESALVQPEVAEVLLIEDASPDNALEICRKLEREYDKVKLLRHPNGENKGAGASRNLGIRYAKHKFVSFLDADDYYLPDRFTNCVQLFNQSVDIDGVYGIAKHEYTTVRLEKIYKQIYRKKESYTRLLGVLPQDVFSALMGGGNGYFHINTLTVKKDFFKKIGYFDESLKQTQDTDMFLRMSLEGNLYSDNEKPIAVVRIHGENRVLNTKEAIAYRNKLMQKWMIKMLEEDYGKRINRYLVRSYLDSHEWVQGRLKKILFRMPIKTILLLQKMVVHPNLLKKLL